MPKFFGNPKNPKFLVEKLKFAPHCPPKQYFFGIKKVSLPHKPATKWFVKLFMLKNKNPIIFIFITLLVDVIGIGLIIPVLPQLVQQLTQTDLSHAARYSGWLIASYALMQFICSPIVGGLSDQYGRRPVLLASLAGLGIDYIFMAVAPTIGWLFVGRIIAGIAGASFTTATAYIADISTPEKRAQNFGMVGAAFGLGFILGPLLGGLLGELGLRVPFYAAAVMSSLNWLYGFFILPESLLLENRRPFNWRRANPVSSLLNLKKYPLLFGLVSCAVFVNLAGQTHPSTWALFTMKMFNWSSAQVGYSLAFVGVMIAFVQGFLIRKAVPMLGENRAIMIGLFFFAFGFFLFGIASRGWMMYAIMIPFSLSGIAGPTLQALMTKQVPADAQGELQGALTSLVSLTTIIGPLVSTSLFAYFTSPDAPVHVPGAAFLMASLLGLIAWFIFLKVQPQQA